MGARKKGLWFSARRIEIQTVTNRHKKCCSVCHELPEERRLHVRDGSGRHQSQSVFCQACGHLYLKKMRDEAENAMVYLSSGEGQVRE